MKIYIAGKIEGDPGSRAKFEKISRVLEATGNIVLNPEGLPEGLTVEEYLRICLVKIDVADVVVFMLDRRLSGGAQLEKAYCDYTEKTYRIMEESR